MTIPTPFEERNATDAAWTSLAEQQTFLAELVSLSDRVAFEQIGTVSDGLGVDLVRIGHPTPRNLSSPQPKPILIVALQHGNEPAGREALFALIRDLAFTDDTATVNYLADNTVYAYPTANPWGLPDNRLTADGTDMGRFHMRLTTLETIVLGGLMRDLDPGVVVDLHEQSGTPSQDIQLLNPTNAEVDSEVVNLSQELIDDYITTEAVADGYTVGRFNGGDGGFQLRNTAGFRHAISVLTETSFSKPDRIERVGVQRSALEGIMRFDRERRADILTASEGSASRQTSVGLERTAPFDAEGVALLDPPPAGYVLTGVQLEATAFNRDVFGISSYQTEDDEWFVPMGQAARAAIPYMFDASAETETRLVSASRSDVVLSRRFPFSVLRGNELVAVASSIVRDGTLVPA